MTRFGLSSGFSSPAADDYIYEVAESPSSLRGVSLVGPLSCLSPDGRSVFSLLIQKNGQVFIESHHLPLVGTTDEEEIERDFPALVRTRLPQSVQAVLSVDTPVELLCVDGEATSRPPRGTEEPQKFRQPLLALYTRHDVFLLQLAFTCPFSKDEGSIVEGEVLSVHSPFESHLAGLSTSTKIVRVRPAPQRRMGYAILTPPGAMAMLTQDSTMNGYKLLLYHGVGSNNLVTTPLEFGFEALHDDTSIMDFCFGQSNGLALFATMSIQLLKASGEVFGASPVLFDGSVVPRTLVEEAVDYEKYSIDQLGMQNPAKWRQMLVVRQYLVDAFLSHDDGQSHHLKAHVRAHGDVRTTVLFPLQIQGPVILPAPLDPDEAWTRSLVMEPFFCRDFVGMAIGRENDGVDFAVMPVSAILPRFLLESEDDQYDLDGDLSELGVVVERIAVESEDKENVPKPVSPMLVSLVRDPVMANMIHYASSQGVLSISTNCMRFISSKLCSEQAGFLSPESKRANETIRTSAWSCLDVSVGADQVRLVGAVVSGDAHLGHTLVGRLSDGSMTVVNLTESRYLHESKSTFAAPTDVKDVSSATQAALQAVEESKPLHELLKPLMTKVNDGLSGMSKIVGGATAQKDINAATLAAFLSVKERCEKDVMLPLREMNEISASRVKTIQEMYKSQVSQIEALKTSLKTLKERMSASAEKLETAEANARILAQRSSSLIQACQDLQPTLSHAEMEFINFVKRLDAKCQIYEDSVKQFAKAAHDITRSLSSSQKMPHLELSKSEIDNCHDLLKGQELMIERSVEKLKKTSVMLNEVAAATGLSNDSLNGDAEQTFRQGR